MECLVFWCCFFWSDGITFCHSHDGPVAASDGVCCSLSGFYGFICHTYTNFPVLLFQIKIRITPVARALHTQNKNRKKAHTHAQQYQEEPCSR